ncbi:hypothetical protein CYMTET_37245 [Cymbomonas tetramitiformis]|uniref:Uncharacterized protein n=1 Tax=Cymbomonas tetramitiformis TaxID=36881 RepID=A0AAE0CFN8_9CHLO|nr:hypothetical protein CYMTET_37245 [Cymbomonas tetramitiformis]
MSSLGNPNFAFAEFSSQRSATMSADRQNARMPTVHSALASFRVHRWHPAPGYGLVVSGGAYAPDTNIESIAFADDDDSEHDELRPQHPPLSAPPFVPLGHCVVVCGGVTTSIPPILPSACALIGGRVGARRIFHLPSPCPLFVDASALVVPGRFWLWHRTGVG